MSATDIMKQIVGAVHGKAQIRALALSGNDAQRLERSLHKDCQDHFYSACVSFCHGLQSASLGGSTWATVKMYYAVFYALRAMLAMRRHCIFHIGRQQYLIVAQQGQSPTSQAGNTHQSVIDVFRRLHPAHRLLSQEIELMDPCSWLMERRDQANYIRTRFVEPVFSSEWRVPGGNGIRSLLSLYTGDDQELYAFDPDHAIVAYPLYCLECAARDIRLQAHFHYAVTDDEADYLRGQCRDRRGQWPVLLDRLAQWFPS